MSGEYRKEQLKDSTDLVEAARFYNTAGIRDFSTNTLSSRQCFERARLLAQKVLKEDSKNELALLEVGIAYARLGLLKKLTMVRAHYLRKGARAFLAVLQENKKNDAALYALGRLFHEQKKYQQAARYYELGLQVNPNNSALRSWSFRLYLVMGMQGQADMLMERLPEIEMKQQVDQRRRLEMIALAMRWKKSEDYGIE